MTGGWVPAVAVGLVDGAWRGVVWRGAMWAWRDATSGCDGRVCTHQTCPPGAACSIRAAVLATATLGHFSNDARVVASGSALRPSLARACLYGHRAAFVAVHHRRVSLVPARVLAHASVTNPALVVCCTLIKTSSERTLSHTRMGAACGTAAASGRGTIPNRALITSVTAEPRGGTRVRQAAVLCCGLRWQRQRRAYSTSSVEQHRAARRHEASPTGCSHIVLPSRFQSGRGRDIGSCQRLFFSTIQHQPRIQPITRCLGIHGIISSRARACHPPCLLCRQVTHSSWDKGDRGSQVRVSK